MSNFDPFRALLRLLPRSFREEHERELLFVWREEVRHAESRPTVRVWLDALVDTLRVAPYEHAAAMIRNVRVAARQLSRAPRFTIAIVLTLALGIGAALGVFGLVNGVLLRPFSWPAADRIGLVWALNPSGARTWLSFPEIEDLRKGSLGFSQVAALTDLKVHYERGGSGYPLNALAVSHDLFPMLGIRPQLGRTFTADDDQSGAAPAVVLAHAFWAEHLGQDPHVVGQVLNLNALAYTVVGVLPPDFELLPASTVLPAEPAVWVPLVPHLASRDRSVRYLHALALLPMTMTFAEADQRLLAHGQAVLDRHPQAYQPRPRLFTIVSYVDDTLRDARATLLLLFGLVMLVLLMACANVANLLVARGEARRQELHVRSALGAGPARLAGELLAESFLLAGTAAAIGALLALLVPRGVELLDPRALPRLHQVGVDLRVVSFALFTIVMTTLLCAAAPLIERLRQSRQAPSLLVRIGGRTRRAARIGRTLTIIQVAFATTVLIVAVFLTDGLVRLQRVGLGFEPARVLTGRVSLSPKYPAGAPAARFFATAATTLAAAPGVVRGGAITELPLSGSMLSSSFVVSPDDEQRRIDADLRGLAGDYFQVMSMPMLSGRPFNDHDTGASRNVVVVDELFARRLDPSLAVLGREIRWARQPDVPLEIVGVVGSVRHRGPDHAARETVYRPAAQYPRTTMFVALQMASSASMTAPDLRGVLRRIDASQSLSDIATMEQRLHGMLTRAKVGVAVAAVLAGLSAMLAGVGLYGVLSVDISQRTREFGIRLSLGETPGRLCWRVVREGVALSLVGTVLGMIGAAGAMTALRAAMFEPRVADPVLYAAAALVVLALSSAALWLPARRASRMEPLLALQAD